MEGLRPPFVPALPWLSRTPETNVRTYAIGPGGESGIWFLSLDIARLLAFAVARSVYRLPYMWSSLAFERTSRRVRYAGRRRLPRPHAAYEIDVEIGDAFEHGEATGLDHCLTA